MLLFQVFISGIAGSYRRLAYEKKTGFDMADDSVHESYDGAGMRREKGQ